MEPSVGSCQGHPHAKPEEPRCACAVGAYPSSVDPVASQRLPASVLFGLFATALVRTAKPGHLMPIIVLMGALAWHRWK